MQTSDDLLKTCDRSNNIERIQPFLICAMDGSQKKGNYYIKVDNHKILVGDNIMVAFDTMVKLHYIFDVKFAPDLEFFYNFITSIVMDINNDPKNVCSAFNTTLQYLNFNDR